MYRIIYDREEVSTIPTFNTSDLIGRKVLLPKDADTEEQFRANVVPEIDEHKDRLGTYPERVNFLF